MTETEWLTSTNAQEMLFELTGRAGERDLRLFAIACCHRIMHQLPSPVDDYLEPLQLCEQYAREAQHDPQRIELYLAAVAASAAFAAAATESFGEDSEGYASHAVYAASALTGSGYADTAATIWSAAADASLADEATRSLDERKVQSDLLRDVFGNPFRSVTIAPQWRTASAVALAESMYQSRDFAAMPILADALQDAGCDNEDILSHCRGPGPHVRGCWVVDLVTGRE